MYYENRGRRNSRDRNYGTKRFPPKPVEIGKEYDVEILETSRRGEGIARIEGLVCFIPNTKPGDHVRIRITRISRRFAEAEAVGPSEKTVESVTPEPETPEPETPEPETPEESAETK